MSCFNFLMFTICFSMAGSPEAKQNKDVIASILVHEGFRSEPYPDPIHGWYKPTFGHGLTYIELEESKQLVENRVVMIRRELEKAKPVFKDLTPTRQDALIEMGFQMGMRGLLGFNRMWDAIEAGDFQTAHNEALDSLWSLQTPNRARRVAAKLR